MADNDNEITSVVPGARTPLSESLKKLANGIKIRKTKPYTEDRGGEVEVHEAIKDGVVTGRYVKKGDKVLETMASPDAQASGDSDKQAKAAGVKPEQTVKTSVTAVARDLVETDEPDWGEGPEEIGSIGDDQADTPHEPETVEEADLGEGSSKEVKPKKTKESKKTDTSMSKMASQANGPTKVDGVLEKSGKASAAGFIKACATHFEKLAKKKPSLEKASGGTFDHLHKLLDLGSRLPKKGRIEIQPAPGTEPADVDPAIIDNMKNRLATEKKKPELVRDMMRMKAHTESGRPFRVMAGSHPDHKKLPGHHFTLDEKMNTKQMHEALKKPTSPLSRQVLDAIDSGHDTMYVHQPDDMKKNAVAGYGAQIPGAALMAMSKGPWAPTDHSSRPEKTNTPLKKSSHQQYAANLHKRVQAWSAGKKKRQEESKAQVAAVNQALTGAPAQLDKAGTGKSPAQEIVEAHNKNGGSTYNLKTGHHPGGDVYIVSSYLERSHITEGQLTPEVVDAFIQKNQDLLSQPNHHVGTWHDPDSKKNYLDVSVTTPHKEEAIALAKKHNQKAIFHVGTMTTIPTGGTGELNKTEGDNPNHNPKIRQVADSYAQKIGVKLNHNIPVQPINEERADKIAQAYHSMPHSPNDPNTKKAYSALVNETKNQFDHMMQSGLKVSKIQPGQENPYPTSKHMFEDIKNNNHLWYFPTEQGFGSGADASSHPLLQNVPDHEGKPMPANDMFRIVHDYFGHAKEGNGFGPKGEEAAWRHHVQMFSPEAAKALTSETRGQNSWVNFGPHSEHNRKNPGKTIYADQKAGLLPDWAMDQK